MADQSKLLGVFPNDLSRQDGLPAHVERLAGAEVTLYQPEYVTEGLLTFRWRGHTFRGDTALGGSWTFYAPADCPSAETARVFAHLARYLGADASRRYD